MQNQILSKEQFQNPELLIFNQTENFGTVLVIMLVSLY